MGTQAAQHSTLSLCGNACSPYLQHAGTQATPSCSPTYAPPEVLDAYCEKRSVAVHASQDMWALGVMAFETIARTRAFPHFGSMDMILQCSAGTALYPWERPEEQLVRSPLLVYSSTSNASQPLITGNVPQVL
jgi:serine/threonine protein kinase